MTSFGPFTHYTGEVQANDPLREALPDPTQYFVKNLTYRALPTDETQDTDFLLKPHQILWNYWIEKKGDHQIARYKHIDPIDFNKAIGYVLLLEPNETNTDFRYRVYGSSVVDQFGQEMTGKWLSDFGDYPGKLSLAQYPQAVRLRCPLYSEHNAAHEGNQMSRWCRLILPMENMEGHINRILVGTVPVPNRR
ncbi:PAS domain-containing protein [Sneathiella aquimaris]|uniref:PAS domain-containing protein n=1 Tax=Sneathiella aquimaris TaxID=2599305 RepID=UPI00146B6FDD|nr:PAS domain-containing protein [Sneathiella aquimaris]